MEVALTKAEASEGLLPEEKLLFGRVRRLKVGSPQWGIPADPGGIALGDLDFRMRAICIGA
jgi:hypothetical protein